MIRMTALYGHPTDPEAFERYYAQTHGPLVARMQGQRHWEQTRAVGAPGGEQPAFYRAFDFWFDDQAHMQQVLATPEAQAVLADVPKFATGGVTILISQVEAGA